MKLRSQSFAVAVAVRFVLSLRLDVVFAQCPPAYTPDPDAVGPIDYMTARQTCTEACNGAGYCCTLGYGGGQKLPCTEGCHLAFFTSNVQACYDACDVANSSPCGRDNCCYYTHERHPDVGWLGFNPEYVSTGEVAVKKCGGSEPCGCPYVEDDPHNWGNDATSTSCYAGCDFALSEIPALMFNGENVVYDPRKGLDGTALLEATQSLIGHIDGSSPMSATSIDDARHAIQENGPLLPTDLSLMTTVMDLIATYETTFGGGLFVNDRSTPSGFQRNPSSSDGNELERAILQAQQSALDEIYHGTLQNFHTFDRLYGSIVKECAPYLDGRKWQTAKYFPGEIEGPPADPSVVHLVDIDATMPESWGRPVAFSTDPSIRPTALYLQPGGVAVVTLPASVVDETGFKIQVGANIVNNHKKSTHKRMDRITTTFDVKETVTHVANPLGGAIYLRVPYLSDLGLTLGTITVNVTGGVVKAPFFRKTDVSTTTEQEWTASRTSAGPWVDIETNNLLLQVPRIWMYNYNYTYTNALVGDWEKSMDGVSELFGFPYARRNNYVLFLHPDLYIRGGAYAIGYPQVNNAIAADDNGPKAVGPPGMGNHWLVRDPAENHVEYHELGHAQLFSKYRGENEAAVNLLLVYVQNVKFGYNLDEAFKNSFSTGKYSIDAAAIHWMITDNFLMGNEMDTSNSENNEMRYQHRGYAKYADIARLYGWGALRDFFNQEHCDYMNAATDGRTDTDERTLYLSIAAEEDLTPLIHFWGIHPEDPVALKDLMEQHGLYPSESLQDHIASYSSIVPEDQAAFIKHFDEVYPGKKDCQNCGCSNVLYGCGWYNANYPLWDETKAQDAVNTIHEVIDLYYDQPSSQPSQSPAPSTSMRPSGTPSSSAAPSGSPSASPTSCTSDADCSDADSNPCINSQCVFGSCQPTPISGCENGATLETWLGIEGRTVPDLTNSPRYPGSPNETSILTDTLETSRQGDNLGNRMQTYLYPPDDGNYTFYIASDDNGELWLSNDDDPANSLLIAHVGTTAAPKWTSHLQWDKFPEDQRSDPIFLVRGQPIWLQAINKEGIGGDNLGIGWESDNMPLDVISAGYTTTSLSFRRLSSIGIDRRLCGVPCRKDIDCSSCGSPGWTCVNLGQNNRECQPTSSPDTPKPSNSPSAHPSVRHSAVPSSSPTSISSEPSSSPSNSPSTGPSTLPSLELSTSPSESSEPSSLSSSNPSHLPTSPPSGSLSHLPSAGPSSFPSLWPSIAPSAEPSKSPMPSVLPLENFGQPECPTGHPSSKPSNLPSESPSSTLSSSPSRSPSSSPSALPSLNPSSGPSSEGPSLQPSSSLVPSEIPSSDPSHAPSRSPTSQPSAAPTPAPVPAPVPCVDLKPTNWCSKPNRCPHENCRQTCGECDEGRSLRTRAQKADLFNPPKPKKSVNNGKPPIVFSEKNDPPGLDRAAVAAKRENAHRRWKARGPKDYDFVYEREPFAGIIPEEERGPFQVQVRDGAVASVVYLNSAVRPETYIVNDIPTIDAFFSVIRREEGKGIASVLTKYDEDSGYPQKLIVEYLPGSEEVMSMHYIREVEIPGTGKKDIFK